MPTYPENMNLTTAAKYLGVSAVTIRRMLKDREIPAAKIRGRWLFKKNVIDEWLAKNSWSRVKKSLKKREHTSDPNSKKMHPAVARLFAAMDNFDNSGLDPADWDEAKRMIAEEEAKRERELIELAERYE
ncbi:MAG: helix-turn-helix domain-containing protein [candidate division KSB1 bacterium]|nr:helix-turn-helix domain-containing protein [candidate division KSB1 bacterium]MDZ7364426.1 helix-turn-helix domain-containing protein [candidate division KSB1 bacterium]MDZ7402798.1 helix-turn-helix domain-containing protein [candidate division KSB1 bacterium]